MKKVVDKIKGARHGRHGEADTEYEARGATVGDEYGAAGTTTGIGAGGATMATTGEEGAVERPVAVGVAEVPVVVTEAERVRGEGGARAGEEVCGQRTFTEVEDRPVVVERVQRVVEHAPVEKQYVVETRFVGERPAPHLGREAEVVGEREYVVEQAAPGPTCPAGTGAMMENVVRGVAGTHVSDPAAAAGAGGVADPAGAGLAGGRGARAATDERIL